MVDQLTVAPLLLQLAPSLVNRTGKVPEPNGSGVFKSGDR